MKKLLIPLGILIICSIIMLGCSTATTPTTPSAPASTSAKPTTETPPSGGTLVLIIPSRAVRDNIGDITGPMGGDTAMANVCLQHLINVDSGNLQPELAEKWAFAADGKSMTFYLRKGIKFHDGTDFNAQAAKFSLELGRDSNLNAVKDYTMDVIDDYTLKVNYPSFNHVRLYNFNLATYGFIVSPTAIKAHDANWARTNPVGTGPFKIVSYEKGTSAKFIRFDNYWGGKPYLDNVEFRIIADPTTSLLALKAGEAHIMQIEPKDAQDLQKAGFLVHKIPFRTTTLIPSGKNPNSPFADIRVRQALSYALDRQAIADAVGSGFYIANNQPFGPDSWAYNSKVVGQPYDPVKAKSLLAQAGYPNGFNTKIIHSVTNDFLTLCQDYWKRVGINAELQIVSGSVVLDMSMKGWEGIILNGVGATPKEDPSRQFSYITAANRTAFASIIDFPDMDALQAQIATEVDQAKRKNLAIELIRLMVDEHCIAAFACTETNLTAFSSKVQGVMGSNINYVDLSKAWLRK